jgi:hypothetical protein
MPRYTSSLMWTAIAICAACNSSSVPSDRQAREVIDHSFKFLTNNGAKIVDFKKINGEQREVSGQKVYVFHYVAAAELPDGFAWQDQGLMPDGGFGSGFIKDPAKGPSSLWGRGKIKPMPKGAFAIRRGNITFRLTDKGWVSADLPDTAQDAWCTEERSPSVCYEQLGWNKINVE